MNIEIESNKRKNNMALSNKENQAAFKKRKKDVGLERVEYWATPFQHVKLKELFDRLKKQRQYEEPR